jgi:hypothetical protein
VAFLYCCASLCLIRFVIFGAPLSNRRPRHYFLAYQSYFKTFLRTHSGSGSTVGSEYVPTGKFERDGLLLRIVLEGANFKGWPFSTRQVLVLIVLEQLEQSPFRSSFSTLSGFWPSSFLFCAILAMKYRSA